MPRLAVKVTSRRSDAAPGVTVAVIVVRDRPSAGIVAAETSTRTTESTLSGVTMYTFGSWQAATSARSTHAARRTRFMPAPFT